MLDILFHTDNKSKDKWNFESVLRYTFNSVTCWWRIITKMEWNRIELNFIVLHFIRCFVLYCVLGCRIWNRTWHAENGVIEIACNVSRFVFISTRILHFRGSIRFSVSVHINTSAHASVCVFLSLWIGFCFPCSPLCSNSNHPIMNDNLLSRMNPGHKTIDQHVNDDALIVLLQNTQFTYRNLGCEWRVSHVCECETRLENG